MGLFRNAVHSLWIMLFFFTGATAFNLIGLDIFLPAIFSPLGVVVALLLTFFETTYTRL